MEDREELKRQIELLQNLIDEHKSIHGDTPFQSVAQRQQDVPTSARSYGGMSVVRPQSSRGRPYYPHSQGSWRKTYSLRNKSPQFPLGHPSASSSSHHQSSSHNISHSASLPGHSRGEESERVRNAASSSGIFQPKIEGQISTVGKRKGGDTEKTTTGTLRKTAAAVSQCGDLKSTGTQSQGLMQVGESRGTVLSEKKVSGSTEVSSTAKAVTSSSLQSGTQGQAKPPMVSRTSTASKGIIHTTTPATVTSSNSSESSRCQVGTSFLKKSKFTWVKSQNVGGVEPKQASSVLPSAGKAVAGSPTSISKAALASASSTLPPVSKKTPAKKIARKLSPVTIAPKTSKYKWVSSSAGAQAKTSRKSLSPKALTLSQRVFEKGETPKKLRVAPSPSAKMKKGGTSSSSNPSLSSRYRWKAGGQSVVATGGVAVARRGRSAFHWTSDKSGKRAKGGLASSPSAAQLYSPPYSSSPGGFKLRSRMKIIRKSAISHHSGLSDRSPTPSEGKYSPRGRTLSWRRSPAGLRRSSPRELVSFGRHKLRRLSPGSARTRFALSHRGRGSQRPFRGRPGYSTRHSFQYNPSLSWRAKRIQSARTFLQSRLRAPHDRHSSSAQHWRGSSMCWIHGSLYRVSANKLSRTVALNTSINRTGKSFHASHFPPTSPASSRASTTRYLASRAVQRSLAIIRHARHKKQLKQYCMYYNRFGKCNRGNSCTYIHDPDKVAVCTRFLRGTCKQADGTCPFSHKVAKEKMPVCSYFLKGICNNSDCPYSHVYVSRKAQVCDDFVKGYCPEGEKCKKKHTLVCPDFSKTGSCPQGARCKLQHRQPARRGPSPGTATIPAKRPRTKEPPKRSRLSVVIPQAAASTPPKGPLELPSFISLSSSPEEADTPDTRLSETSRVKEKKLQIKPRL